MDTGLLLLRWVIGLTLLAHGAQKLFGGLSAPWGIQFPDADAAHLYVVARGGARLELADASPAILAAGDVAFLPHGVRHCLRDAAHSALRSLDPGECRRHQALEPIRLGGGGAPTTLVAVAFAERQPIGQTARAA
jgi:hypothetical protein